MLTASLALAIGLAIYDLTVREIDLSLVATQSQYAVYASDTAAECALFWDSKYVNAGTNDNGGSQSAFATSSADILAPSSGITCGVDTLGASLDVATLPPTTDIARYQTGGDLGTECNGYSAGAWCTSSSASAATTTFEIGFKPQLYCAVVQVAKHYVGSDLYTTVNSRGYNTCAVGGVRVERTLQVSY